MAKIELGALQRLDPRQVWSNEAYDFTPWLAENLDRLGEVLGLDLEFLKKESEAGDFSIDILAKDIGRDRFVVVENQLEPTDHTHLGQLITYAAGVEAGVVVWVCREFREEHRQALDWLNRGISATTEFFGVVVEILQIDGSKPAVDLRLVAAPNNWSRKTGSRTPVTELTDKQLAFQQFFQRLIDELREKHRFTNARAGQPKNWCSFTSGVNGIGYGVSFATRGRLRIDLYIDVADADLNHAILESLRSEAERLVSEFGESLEWEDLPQKRACRVACYRTGSIEDSQGAMDEYHEWAIDRLLRFKRVFGPRLPKLVSESSDPVAR